MTSRRGAFLIAGAVVATAQGLPASAQPAPIPSLTIEPVTARNLLAPAERDWKLSLTEIERGEPNRNYRLGRDDNRVTGRRARVSVEVGDTTFFAVGGTLGRRAEPGPPDLADFGQQKPSRSKQYGVGLARTLGPAELTAGYQYSKVSPERSESNLNLSNPRSHSVRATARIRFTP